MAFWHAAPTGVLIAARVQPKSRRPGLNGVAPAVDGERLRIGVTAAAEDGRANRAACELVARALGVPASAVAVASGARSREKTLRVTGDPAAIAARLAALEAAAP